MRRLLLAVVAACAVACGDSPTSPTGANLSGTWQGSASTAYGLAILTTTLTQNGAAFTGSWSADYPSNPSLSNSGQLAGTKTGANVMATLSPSNPTNCPYTFNGTLDTATSMTGTFASFNCTLPTSATFTLRKQ